MFRRLTFLMVMAATAFLLSAANPASACVGKTLVIGGVNAPNVMVVSEMLSILITERTGTTVVVKYFDDYKGCYAALKKNEVDIMVDYTGRCYVDVLGMKPEPDEAKVFSTVKESYQREMNLVWLEPFGFSDASVMSQGKGGGTPAVAAPIVRKDTLTKFPALPRVINKLAGKLGNDVMARLATESGQGKNAKKVTRKFLKDNRLI
jgi:osmoprotectant transport system substrate-binding protein